MQLPDEGPFSKYQQSYEENQCTARLAFRTIGVSVVHIPPEEGRKRPVADIRLWTKGGERKLHLEE
jgi:hypothetical protein